MAATHALLCRLVPFPRAGSWGKENAHLVGTAERGNKTAHLSMGIRTISSQEHVFNPAGDRHSLSRRSSVASWQHEEEGSRMQQLTQFIFVRFSLVACGTGERCTGDGKS